MTRPLALPRSRSTTELGSSTPAWIPFNEDRRTGSAASPAASGGSKKRPPSAASRSTLPQARYALRVDDSRNESLRTCVAKMAMVPIIKAKHHHGGLARPPHRLAQCQPAQKRPAYCEHEK